MREGIEWIGEQNTPEWYEFRRTGGPGNPFPTALGASDIAILMAGTRQERERLFMEKCGVIEPQEANVAMQAGHDAEPTIRERYMERMGVGGRPATLYSPDHPWLFASCDFMSDDSSLLAEMKLMGRDNFEEFGSVAAKPRHRWQAMAQLQVVRQAEACHLVAAQWGHVLDGDLALAVIEPDEEAFAHIIATATRFLAGVTHGDGDYALGDKPALEPSGGGGPGGGDSPQGAIASPGAASRQGGPVVGLAQVSPASLAMAAEQEAAALVARFAPARDELLLRIGSLTIVDGDTADRASEGLAELTTIETKVGAELTAVRKKFTKPADAVSEVVKGFLAPVSAMKRGTKEKLNEYIERAKAEKDARDREAAKLAADLRKAGHTDAAVTAAVDMAFLENPVAPMPAGVASWREPTFKVTEAASVPRDHMMVDERMVRDTIKASWKAAKEVGETEDSFIAKMAARLPGVKVEFVRRTKSI